MSTYFAKIEGTEAVAGTPSNSNELQDEIRHFASSLDVVKNLQGFVEGLDITHAFPKRADYYVLELDIVRKKLEIKSHRKLDAATTNVMEGEIARAASDTVLIGVSELNALRVAYPNYFADTKEFLKHLSHATRH